MCSLDFLSRSNELFNMFFGGESDVRRLFEKQHGGTKDEPLAKIGNPGRVNL